METETELDFHEEGAPPCADSFSSSSCCSLGAHLNLTALVPAAAGQVRRRGGSAAASWPFFADTRTLVPAGDVPQHPHAHPGDHGGPRLLLAGCALLGWLVPGAWLRDSIVGASASIVLQLAWLSGWAILPLAVDAALLWLVFGLHLTAPRLRRRAAVQGERAQ